MFSRISFGSFEKQVKFAPGTARDPLLRGGETFGKTCRRSGVEVRE